MPAASCPNPQHTLFYFLVMRRLTLHASALNDAEYDLYTRSLGDLVESDDYADPNRSFDDAYFDHLNVGVREARAWLRGRYSHLLASDIDSVSSMQLVYDSNSAHSDCFRF